MTMFNFKLNLSASKQTSLFALAGLTTASLIYYWFQMDLCPLLLFNRKIKYRSDSKKSVLTIDDAPYTDESFRSILDVLKKHNTTATFFVISGFVTPRNRSMLIEAVQSGHHLANHGSANSVHCLHNYLTLDDEMANCQELIDDVYAEANVPKPTIKYYRPGHGLVSPTIADYCAKNNYEIVLGNIYPLDPVVSSKMLNKFYIYRHIRGNDIIILHDRSYTPEMLDELLPEMKQMDYEISSLC